MKKKKKCTITKDREYALYTTHKYESDNHIFIYGMYKVTRNLNCQIYLG